MNHTSHMEGASEGEGAAYRTGPTAGARPCTHTHNDKRREERGEKRERCQGGTEPRQGRG
jgi:hypothetical protein